MTESKKISGGAASSPPTNVTTTTKKEESKNVNNLPPVEAAGRRLERLFRGGRSATPTAAPASSPSAAAAATASTGVDATATTTPVSPSTTPAAPSATPSAATAAINAATLLSLNPPKIVKKWLGSSSGTASSATLAEVSHAAFVLLDPSGKCATGRELLVLLSSEEERLAVAANAGKGGAGAKKEGDAKKEGGDKMEIDAKDTKTILSSSFPDYTLLASREVESWLISLAIRILWRSCRFEEAYALSEKGLAILDAHLAECGAAATTSVFMAGVGGMGSTLGTSSSSATGTTHMSTAEALSLVLSTPGGLHPLLARMLRYRNLTIESLPDPYRKSAISAALRPELSHRHRMACLRRDGDVSSTVLNLMLRDLLEADQVEQAQKLLSNSTFPTETATNNQLLRYLYYSGRIQALRLEYTSSFSNLSQCLRKSPAHSALGFRIAVQRLSVVVQLLMGEIPDRAVFYTEGMRGELKPYLEIAQAVRRGDLAVFHSTVGRHAERLKKDGTFTLISRLAHSVVKAGLRRLKTSYSRISLEDVAMRLGLPSATSAEFVVAKAVRDGVIDATIDHEGGYVQSHDLVDVYATVEPAEAFHRRIAYCLTTHNDAVRGMRYPPDAYKKQLEASRGLKRRGEDSKTDEEKAQELEEEMDEDY